MQQHAAMLGKREIYGFVIPVYNMIILKLFKDGISSIGIISPVWDDSVISYGVWKEKDEIIVAAFKVLMSRFIWELRNTFEFQSGYPLQGID
jgi:hypothetical protein